MMQTAPKFSKIELVIKGGKSNLDYKLEYLDCGLVITGNYLIIVLDVKDELNSSESSQGLTYSLSESSQGMIYSLSEIRSYKTYKY